MGGRAARAAALALVALGLLPVLALAAEEGGGAEMAVVDVWLPSTLEGNPAVYVVPFNASSPPTFESFYVVDAASGQPMFSHLFSGSPPLALVFDPGASSKRMVLHWGAPNRYPDYTVPANATVFAAYDDFDYPVEGMWIVNGTVSYSGSVAVLSGTMELNATIEPVDSLVLWRIVGSGVRAVRVSVTLDQPFTGWLLVLLGPDAPIRWDDVRGPDYVWAADERGQVVPYSIVYLNTTERRMALLVWLDAPAPGQHSVYIVYGSPSPGAPLPLVEAEHVVLRELPGGPAVRYETNTSLNLTRVSFTAVVEASPGDLLVATAYYAVAYAGGLRVEVNASQGEPVSMLIRLTEASGFNGTWYPVAVLEPNLTLVACPVNSTHAGLAVATLDDAFNGTVDCSTLVPVPAGEWLNATLSFNSTHTVLEVEGYGSAAYPVSPGQLLEALVLGLGPSPPVHLARVYAGGEPAYAPPWCRGCSGGAWLLELDPSIATVVRVPGAYSASWMAAVYAPANATVTVNGTAYRVRGPADSLLHALAPVPLNATAALNITVEADTPTEIGRLAAWATGTGLPPGPSPAETGYAYTLPEGVTLLPPGAGHALNTTAAHYVAAAAAPPYLGRAEYNATVKRLPVTIRNPAGYQGWYAVRIELNETNFPDWDMIAPDASNIMFTDADGNNLYHWVEHINLTERKLIAWVNATLNGSDTTIYMYYGNINGIRFNSLHNVFLFEDLNNINVTVSGTGPALIKLSDLVYVHVYDAANDGIWSVTVSDGVATLSVRDSSAGDGGDVVTLYLNLQLTNAIVEVYASAPDWGGKGSASYCRAYRFGFRNDNFVNGSGNDYANLWLSDLGVVLDVMVDGNKISTSDLDQITPTDTDGFIVFVVAVDSANDNTLAYFSRNTNPIEYRLLGHLQTAPRDPMKPVAMVAACGGLGPFYLKVDWIRVRPFVYPEPYAVPGDPEPVYVRFSWAVYELHIANPANYSGWYAVRMDVGFVLDNYSFVAGRCADLLWFTDANGTPLPWWPEECSSTGIVVWVNVTLPGTDATVYLHVGPNPYRSLVDPDKVFIFYDDFNTLDRSVWAEMTGTWGVENGYLIVVNDYGAAPGNLIYLRDVTWRNVTRNGTYTVAVEMLAILPSEWALGFALINDTAAKLLEVYEVGTVGDNAIHAYFDGSSWNTLATFYTHPYSTGDVVYERLVLPAGTFMDVTNSKNGTDPPYFYNGYIGIHHTVWRTTRGKVDWFRIRPYVEPEPYLASYSLVGTDKPVVDARIVSVIEPGWPASAHAAVAPGVAVEVSAEAGAMIDMRVIGNGSVCGITLWIDTLLVYNGSNIVVYDTLNAAGGLVTIYVNASGWVGVRYGHWGNWSLTVDALCRVEQPAAVVFTSALGLHLFDVAALLGPPASVAVTELLPVSHLVMPGGCLVNTSSYAGGPAGNLTWFAGRCSALGCPAGPPAADYTTVGTAVRLVGWGGVVASSPPVSGPAELVTVGRPASANGSLTPVDPAAAYGQALSQAMVTAAGSFEAGLRLLGLNATAALVVNSTGAFLAVNGSEVRVGEPGATMVVGLGVHRDPVEGTTTVYLVYAWPHANYTRYVFARYVLPGVETGVRAYVSAGLVSLDRFAVVYGAFARWLAEGRASMTVSGPYPLGSIVKMITVTRPIIIELVGGTPVVRPGGERGITLVGFRGWLLSVSVHGVTASNIMVTSDRYVVDVPPGFTAVLIVDPSSRTVSIVSAAPPPPQLEERGIGGEAEGPLIVVPRPVGVRPPTEVLASQPTAIVALGAMMALSMAVYMLRRDAGLGLAISGAAGAVMAALLGATEIAVAAVLVLVAGGVLSWLERRGG